MKRSINIARGKKTGGRDFGPDNPPPKSPGKHVLPPEIRDLRKLTVEEFQEMVFTLLTADERDLREIDDEPRAPVVQKIISTILQRALETGSMKEFDLLLNRLFGKVKDQVVHDFVKPSVLQRRDGTEVVFNLINKKSEDGDNG